jgi:DNA-binding LytR/AlgR family response regulator
MMQIAICDDNKVFLDDIHDKLTKLLPEEVEYLRFESGDAFLNADVEPDFLFLDIEMPGTDGITLKDLLDSSDKKTRIIFLTNYENRMREAFGNRVIGFLNKPVDIDDLKNIADKILRDIQKRVYEFDIDNKHVMIPVDDILYIESDDKYTYLNTAKKERYCIRRTMKEWIEDLPEELFCRINRSYIIHYDLCKNGIKKILLPDNREVEVSRLYRDKLKKGYTDYLLSGT